MRGVANYLCEERIQRVPPFFCISAYLSAGYFKKTWEKFLVKFAEGLENASRLPVCIYTVSQKTGPHFTAYSFRNIEQIFTKFGRNHVLFMLNIMP